jgi:hypothetical protein
MSVSPPNKKRCSRCRTIKPLDEFSPCKTGKWGKYNYCKECHRVVRNESRPNRKIIDEKEAKRMGLRSQGLKTCTSCREIKHLEDFYGDPRHTDGKQSFCKECFNQKSNDRYLMHEYGITSKEFKELMDAQDGRCAICRRAPKNYKFNIDHDHNNHKLRGLLCVNCNTNLLPYVERFPEWIKDAFSYLENPPAFSVIGEIEVPETNQSRIRDTKT